MAAVVHELHDDPFGEPARYDVVAAVRRDAGRIRAHIELRDHDTHLGARDLEGRDCEELVPAMAWVIALAVEPLLKEPPAAAVASQPPAAPTPPVLAPKPPPALEVPPAPPVRQRFALRVGIGLGAAIDASPSVAPAFSLVMAALRPRYSFGAELRADIPAGGGMVFGGALSTTQAMALVVPCLRHSIASVCALGAIGLEHGAGSGYADARSATALYAGLGGRIAVEVPLIGRLLYLRMHADLLAALTRLELYVGTPLDAAHRVYRTPPVSSAFGTAFLLEIP